MGNGKAAQAVAACLLPLLLAAACGRAAREPAGFPLESTGFRKTGYPIVSAPYRLRVLASQHQDTPKFDTLEIFQKLEERTGVQVEWEYSGKDWNTKKPLFLAAPDELPDVIMTKLLNEGDVVRNQELFWPLDDLINEYAPNIKAMLEADPMMANFARAYDGHIYGLPQKMPARPETYCVWGINQVWLDRLGLAMPETTEEFYHVLKAFKERDPNGNGLADEIPCTFLGLEERNRGFMDIFPAFGVNETTDYWLSVSGGKVRYIAAQEGFKEATMFLHRLYAEGLLDPETFTQDRNQLLAKTNPSGNNPEIVGVSSNWGRYFQYGEAHNSHYALLLPLKGPKGHRGWRRAPETVQGTRYVLEIPRSARHPEIAIRWADTLYDKVTSLELYFGPLGTTLTENEDGSFTSLAAPPGFKGNWTWNYALNDNTPCYAADSTVVHMEDQNMAEQLEDKKVLSQWYMREYYPMVALSPEEIDELAILRTDIHSTTTHQFASWVVNGGVEKEYDAFLKTLHGMGLEGMLAIYQAAYDRQAGGGK
jgi:putative aldouronate transport system substrate-binding protein